MNPAYNPLEAQTKEFAAEDFEGFLT